MSDMLNLYSVTVLTPQKETIKIPYWGPSEELVRELLYANLELVVLKIEESDIWKETIQIAEEQITKIESREQEIVIEKYRKEMDEREDLIESWRVEKNMNKSCVSCWKDPNLWDHIIVIRSKKKKGRKIRPVCFCDKCANKITDYEVISSAYREWEWFISIEQIIMELE